MENLVETSAPSCAKPSPLQACLNNDSGTALSAAYAGKRVFVTGHTGFKGAWLCEWLLQLGAEVTGYSLPPRTEPALFTQLDLAHRLQHRLGDIRALSELKQHLAAARPDFVFHLAAQPLVRDSYSQPVETFETNVMGTVNVLESLRCLAHPCAAVLVTTDKCYENRESLHEYREEDPLGGHDPYSASKAAAELVIGSYRRSFFSQHPVKLASVRAGNVIGGGDWARDRIVPDAIRALQQNQPIGVRNPKATRPWQHVLEPLGGYLWLGARLGSPNHSPTLESAFNFGPGRDANRTVAQLLEQVLRHWPGQWQDKSQPGALHEAGLLQLSSAKAAALLGWEPVWSFADSVRETIYWYREVGAVGDASLPVRLTRQQISAYTARATQLGRPWAAAPISR